MFLFFIFIIFFFFVMFFRMNMMRSQKTKLAVISRYLYNKGIFPFFNARVVKIGLGFTMGGKGLRLRLRLIASCCE